MKRSVRFDTPGVNSSSNVDEDMQIDDLHFTIDNDSPDARRVREMMDEMGNQAPFNNNNNDNNNDSAYPQLSELGETGSTFPRLMKGLRDRVAGEL